MFYDDDDDDDDYTETQDDRMDLRSVSRH